MSGITTARRFSLLASTSFVAANMLAGAGALMATAFMPSVALAGCNPDGPVAANPASVTETCSGTDAKISYTGLTHKFDVILDGETVTTTGISVTGLGVDLGITNVLNNSSITGTGAGVNLLTTGVGSVLVDFSGPTTVAVTGSNGVLAQATGSGTATIIFGAGSTATVTTGSGLGAASGTGSVSITNDGAVKATGGGGIGVFAFSDNGTVEYKGKGTITTTGAGSVGLRLETGALASAPTAIKATVDGAIDSAGTGILVGDNGLFVPTGGVTINTTAAVTGKGGLGIDITSGGAGLVKVKTDGTVDASKTAIQVIASGGIDLTTTKTVTTTGFATAVALSDTGATGITYNVNSDVKGGFSGITATEGGTGGINVTVAAGKTVTGNGFEGINATNVNTGSAGAILSTVTLQGNAAVVSTNGNGITASLAGGNGASIAKVDLGGGKVDTSGSGVTGVKAVVNDAGSGGTGSAIVTSGTGAIVKVGLVGGINDTGISVFGSDFVNINTMVIALGDSNTIQVGSLAGKGNTGLSATGDAASGKSEPVQITAGKNLDLKVNGDGSTGILAANTDFTASVTLTSGAIVVGDLGGTANNSVGINATTILSGVGGAKITIDTGTTTIDVQDGIGILTANDLSATSVTAGGLITTTVGDGVKSTTKTGNISITVAGINAGGNGVNAQASGSGKITIVTGAGAVTGAALDGIFANGSGGAIDITTGTGKVTGGAGNGIGVFNTGAKGTGAISIHVGGDVAGGATFNGIFASTSGTGTVLIDAKGAGAVTGPTDGIDAENTSATGAVTIDLSGAAVTVAGGVNGIEADTVGGDINVTTSGLVKAGTGDGVNAAASKGGNVFVNGVGPVTVTGAGDGIVIASDTGNLTVGNLGGGYAGAIDPQGGGNGIKAVITNAASTGNVSVTTATGGSITGKADNGILASTAGLGSVNVDQTGAIGVFGVFVAKDAIQATITNKANTKDVTVAVNGNLNATNDGVNASTLGLGNVKVDVNKGLIAGQNIGISAVIDNAKNVAGNVVVNTSGAVSIASGADGILATTNGEGDVFVTNASFGMIAGQIAGGDGINAFINGPGLPSSDGSVTVVNTGTAATVNGTGIKAATNSNDDVKVTNSGTVFGTAFGVNATNTGVGGAVTVTQTAGATTQGTGDTGAGISATITDLGNSDLVFVDVQGGKVDAQGNGVFAQTKGTGNVKVDNAGTINGGLSGTAGDGVQANALGGGNVLVNNTGTITGDPGIKASAIGFGTVTVFTSGVVSAVKEGIQTTTVNGTNTVTVAGAGTVTSTTDDGIDAKTTGIGLIDINTAAGTTITTTGGLNGIKASQTGTGDIDIDAFGSIVSGKDGINANTAAGTIDILTGSGTIKGGANGILAQSAGKFNVTVTTGTGDVAGKAGAFGILAISAGGNVQVNVGSGGSSEGGVDALTSGTGTATVNVGGDIVDSAFEGVGSATQAGLNQVTVQAGKSVSGNSVGVVMSSTSGPIIFTGLGGSSVNSKAGDGITAGSTLAGGTILITHAGSITAGSDGVDAITADATINITVDGAVTAGGKGLSGVAGGANAVNITNNGAVKATGGEGLNLASAGGTVTATANGTVEGTTAGIKTRTSGAGKTNVDANNTVTATAGIGIDALTTGAGLIDIDTVAVNGTAGGIQATSAGGNITVDNAGAVNGDTDGNKAGTGIKATTIGAGIITVTLGGTVSGGVGIDIATTGSGTLNVVDGGFAVTGTGGDGIKASGGTGNVNIGTGPGSRVIGPISGADDGIDAKGAGNINVFVQGDVTGDTDADGVGDGIHAESAGAGFAVIVDSTGGAIKAGDDGIDAKGLGAGTTVTVVNTDTINALQTGIIVETTDGAVSVDNKGAIDGLAFGAGGQNGIVAHSTTGQITVKNTGNIGAAGAGNGVNNDGIVAQMTTGSANTVTVTNSGNIWVDTGGFFGIFAENPGTGDVTVNNDGEIDPPAIGIFASGAGNVTVNTSKNVTATNIGIQLTDSGVAGKVGTVKTTGGAVINGGVTGIELNSTVGANLVLDAKAGGLIVGGGKGVVAKVSGGGNNGTITIDTVAQVTGTTNDAINASSAGNGAIKISTGPVTGGAAGDGVDASSTGGSSITVTTNGAVLGGQRGVAVATTGAGVISVTTNDTVTGTADDGIKATTTGTGSVTVLTQKSVTGGDDGIQATSAGGPVTVTTNAATTGKGFDGIFAQGGGANTVTVNVGGAVLGQIVGVRAASTGTGTVNVNDTGGFSITGTTNDGIQVTTSGDANVGASTASRINGNVTGADDGIDVLAGGNVNVFTGANVTGDSDTDGVGAGIIAVSSGAGKAVVIDSTTGAIKAGADGIVGVANGVGSTVNITNTDGIEVKLNTGIFGQTANGKLTITNSGNIGATAFSTGLDTGISAQSTSGEIVIKNTGNLGNNAVGTTGLDAFGIFAKSLGANATGITVTNSGTILMDTGSTAGIWAENQGTGTVTVNNTGLIDPANFGINAKSGGNVVVNNAANILANTGIHAETTSVTTGTMSVFQRAPGTSIVGSAGNGIEAFANAAGNTGAVTVGANTVADRIQGNVTGTGASTNGIFAIGNGDVSVFTGTGTMTGGATGASWGIKAQSLPGGAGTGGAVVVDYQGTSVARLGTLAQATGTDATDTVTVNANGQTIGNDGVAILAASVVGTTVNTSQNVKATDATNTAVGNIAARGILAIATGAAATNNVVVNVTNGATVTSVNGAGTGAQEAIRATANGGDVTVTTTAGGNISGATTGIATVANGGTTTVNTLTSTNSANIKTVTGNAGDGINSTSTSGAIVITTGHVSGSGAAGNTSSGINASASVGGAITVNTTGNITGDGTGNAAGTGAAGIRAVTAGGNGNVVVKADPTTNVVAGNVTGGNYGILANSAGTGSTTVTANVLVNGAGGAAVNTATGPVGISATGGSGGVTVTVAAGVTVQAANGRGIVTDTTSASATGGAIGIGAGAQVRGLGDASHAVIDITNTSVTGRTVLTNAGLIQSFSATPAAYGDLAITGKTGVAGGTTGGTTINNNSGGTINGRLVFSGLTGAANLVFNNAAGGVWHTTGASTFGPGADTITNAGQIFTNNAGSATSIDFGTGADTFTNTGALVAGEAQVAASASNLALTGLETFTNNGQISFGGSVGASDNAINDKINAAGALFGGTGKLFMDADLWSISQATCAALTAADCLAVGTTTGLNSIVVNDINTHAVGAFNPNGIALVTGSTNAGANFKLDPASEWYNAAKFGGVLDKPGLFFYDLAWSAANGGTSLLIGVPDTEVFELSELGNAAQSIWYSSTGTWFDRQADLRQSLAGRSEGWAPSVWLKVVGDWTQRDNITSFSIFNKVYAFDVGYNQDTVGLIGGIDFLNVRDGDEAYVFGGQVGYMDSDVRFNSPTRSNFSGMVVGLYGTYMNGGFFLDGIANANFLDLHHYVPTLPGPPAPGSANADVTSFGGQVEAGYQMAIGATGFWEPLASLAYVHTEIDALSLGGNGSVDFPSTVSFRGSLGARVGMSGDFQYYKVRVALTGRLWDEFDGDNSIVVISPGPSNFATNDDFGGTFGEVTLGGNLFTTGGNLSAFANVGVKFRSDYQSTNVSVGFRYQW